MDNSNLHSDEAEVNVIASILVIQDNSKYINSLETQDFYSKTNKAIFSLMKELNDKDETVDLITVKELGVTKKFNGIKLLETMTDMTDKLVYAGNIDKYIKILKNLSVKRKIFNTAKKVCEEISEVDPNKDEIEVKNEVVQKFLNIKTNKKNSNAEMKEVMIETLKDIDDKYQKRDDYSLRTGYLDLDKIIEGLHEQELTLLGARPGVGKTAFSLQMAEHIAKKGVYVYFVSLEMSRKQLGNRIIAREAEIDFAKINEVAGNVADIKMCIDSESTTIQDIEDKANELKQEKNLGLMVIDYLQLLKSRNKFTNREQEVADISRRLKLLSKELDIPVVALCQLNRETEKRRRPLLADLRESGSLEQDADNVIFLYVDDEEKVKNRVIDVEVIVAKQRNGPTRNGKDSI